jgi:hypothetical protein
MNHRDMWHPEKYTTKTRATQVQLPEEADYWWLCRTEQGIIDDKWDVRQSKCLKYHLDVEIDMKTGKGEIISFIKTTSSVNEFA